jgi:hypothetical protein
MLNNQAEPHLFLDFDGVLHATATNHDDQFGRMGCLALALAGSRCRIVISSSWRHHYPLTALLDWFPDDLRLRIVGATGPAEFGRWPRHREILAYVNKHRVAAWRALDDSWIEFPPGCPELIVCDPNRGLDAQQVTEIRTWLASTAGA